MFLFAGDQCRSTQVKENKSEFYSIKFGNSKSFHYHFIIIYSIKNYSTMLKSVPHSNLKLEMGNLNYCNVQFPLLIFYMDPS